MTPRVGLLLLLAAPATTLGQQPVPDSLAFAFADVVAHFDSAGVTAEAVEAALGLLDASLEAERFEVADLLIAEVRGRAARAHGVAVQTVSWPDGFTAVAVGLLVGNPRRLDALTGAFLGPALNRAAVLRSRWTGDRPSLEERDRAHARLRSALRSHADDIPGRLMRGGATPEVIAFARVLLPELTSRSLRLGYSRSPHPRRTNRAANEFLEAYPGSRFRRMVEGLRTTETERAWALGLIMAVGTGLTEGSLQDRFDGVPVAVSVGALYQQGYLHGAVWYRTGTTRTRAGFASNGVPVPADESYAISTWSLEAGPRVARGRLSLLPYVGVGWSRLSRSDSTAVEGGTYQGEGRLALTYGVSLEAYVLGDARSINSYSLYLQAGVLGDDFEEVTGEGGGPPLIVTLGFSLNFDAFRVKRPRFSPDNPDP